MTSTAPSNIARQVLPLRSLTIGLVAVVLALVASSCGDSGGDNTAETTVAPAGPIEGVITVDDLTSEHLDGVLPYDFAPPLGGDHAGIWQNCGFYTEPVLDEIAVHSLEHGVVWVAYEPSVATGGLEALASNDRLLITPYPGLDSPVVATAWGAQVVLEGPDDPRLQLFIDEFVNGSGAPEPGARCTGGFEGSAQDARDEGFGE